MSDEGSIEIWPLYTNLISRKAASLYMPGTSGIFFNDKILLAVLDHLRNDDIFHCSPPIRALECWTAYETPACRTYTSVTFGAMKRAAQPNNIWPACVQDRDRQAGFVRASHQDLVS